MLGKLNLEVFMRLQLKQHEIFGSVPFNFLPDENKLERSEKAEKRKELVKFALLILIGATLTVQVFYQDKNAIYVFQQVQLFLYVSAYDLLCIARWSVFRHGADIVELYNSLVSFQNSCVNRRSGKYFFYIPTPVLFLINALLKFQDFYFSSNPLRKCCCSLYFLLDWDLLLL